MLYNDFNALRIEHSGESLVMREAGLAAAIFRTLAGGFCFSAGGLVLFALVSSMVQGELLPIEPRTWYKWLVWAGVMPLIFGALVVMPFYLGIDVVARDRVVIDQASGSLDTWRGLFRIPIRRRRYLLKHFREVSIRPSQSGVFGNRWHWTVSLEGGTVIQLISADNPRLARSVAGEISQLTHLSIVDYPAAA